MASSWESLHKQHEKIRSAIETRTPPAPSDEYESLRGEVLKHFDKMQTFVTGQVTGDGSVSIPEAEPDR